jgi:enamine deaminase RidA (YjgF/YER057c/UK114 family)
MGNTESVFSFGLPWEDAYGYCQGRKIGSFLRISGQLSHDLEGNFLHTGDFEQQVRATFDNVDRVLAHFQARRSQIVETNVFVRDLADHFFEFAAVHKEYFGEHRPTSNILGVVGLALPDQLVEIAAHVDLTLEG